MTLIHRKRSRNVASCRSRKRVHAHRHLAIESLEDRQLLTTFIVDTLLDDYAAAAEDTDGYVSLREAVQAANTNLPFGDATAGEGSGVVDTIHFDLGLLGKTIVLGGQELTISDNLSITGLGSDELTISGNNASRVFSIASDTAVEISAIAITSGRSLDGGGIFNAGTLTVADGNLSNNLSPLGGAIHNVATLAVAGSMFWNNLASDGAAIWNSGQLQLVSSSFSENKAFSNGGGVWSGGSFSATDSTFSSNHANTKGGGIWNSGTLDAVNTHFSENYAGINGAGIANDFAGTASVTGSDFSANIGDTGGGVWNAGTLDIAHTSFSGNTATQVGGGIANRGEIHVSDGAFLNNSTVRRDEGGNGGAIGNTNGGIVVVADSTFTGNAAGTGGAIDNFGQFFGAFGGLDISNSSFSHNSSALSGGAIWSDDPTTITGSTFSDNVAATYGGAIHIRFDTLTTTGTMIAGNSATYSGGLDIWGADVEISASTISGNSTTLEGGAIENYEGELSIRNSTISGNSTDGVGGGIWNYGTLEIVNGTVVFNRANADGSGSDSGGGIHVVSSTSYPSPLLNNTILAGNLLGAPGADSANEADGAFDPAGSHNLIGDATTAGGLTDGTAGNIVGNAGMGTIDITTVLDPNLADNGGPTLTHAIIVGSLAIDAGNVSLALDADGNPLAYDQRGAGFARVVGGEVDIGAVEFQQQVVEIDIKPGDDSSSINLAGNGLVAVALYTTSDFNAADVDSTTVQFAGAAAVQWALEDVDGDGDLDMILHFDIHETDLAAIYSQLLEDDVDGDGVLDSTQQTATVSLTGETVDGQQILGTDEVDLFFSGKALRELLDQLALAGTL